MEKEFEGPDLLEDEITIETDELQNKKVVGVDDTPAKFWKILGEKAMIEFVGICKRNIKAVCR